MIRSLLAVAVLLLLSTSYGGQVYKWVDENGTTVYSQTPPPRQQAEKIAPPPPPPTNPETARQELDAQIKRLDEARTTRLMTEQEGTAKRTSQQQSKAACEQARQRLAAIPASPQVVMQSPDGTARRLSYEELQKLREEAEKQVADFCGK